MDGCPTNCHTHVLTVTTKDDSNELVESYSDDAFENGSMENGQQCEHIHIPIVVYVCDVHMYPLYISLTP